MFIVHRIEILGRDYTKISKCHSRNWRCRCMDCGTEIILSTTKLNKKYNASCSFHDGSKRINKNNRTNTKHGLSDHPLYTVWKKMRIRCNKQKGDPRYTTRGISVCEEWHQDFKVFYEWSMANGWAKGLHLDRINNADGYCANNCRFVTPKENQRNRDKTKKVVFNGQEASVAFLAETFQKDKELVLCRLQAGWTIEDALFKPLQSKKKPLALNIRLKRLLGGMIRRCKPEHPKKSIYFDKGIYVCVDWINNPENFVSWSMLSGYREGLTIDRIDNNGPYSPENCRWVSIKENCRNKDNSFTVIYNGKKTHLKEIYEQSEAPLICYDTFRTRIKQGWELNEALYLHRMGSHK